MVAVQKPVKQQQDLPVVKREETVDRGLAKGLKKSSKKNDYRYRLACEVCGQDKDIASVDQLSAHLRTHIAPNVHICPIIGCKAKCKNVLAHLLRTHHRFSVAYTTEAMRPDYLLRVPASISW